MYFNITKQLVNVTHFQREYPTMIATCNAANMRKTVVDKQAECGGQPAREPLPPPIR
jgi:hypothetical protein